MFTINVIFNSETTFLPFSVDERNLRTRELSKIKSEIFKDGFLKAACIVRRYVPNIFLLLSNASCSWV